MTVYEMIQQLSKFPADTKINFNIVGHDFELYGKSEFGVQPGRLGYVKGDIDTDIENCIFEAGRRPGGEPLAQLYIELEN